MTRRAILLAASPDDTPIPGVSGDLDAFYRFLRSDCGGAWRDTEILRGENLKRNEVLRAINAAKNSDYSLVFFAGRGKVAKKGLPWPEATLELNSHEAATERDLNSASPRCALFFDCSRKTASQGGETSTAAAMAPVSQDEVSSSFRNMYEESLAAAEAGLVKVYAMAGQGGNAAANSFTQHLLDESIKWAANNRGILHLGNAVTLGVEAMKMNKSQLDVKYHGGRRLNDFPFAVQT